MPPRSDPSGFPPGWIRSDYIEIWPPNSSGKIVSTLAPAVPIIIRNPMKDLSDPLNAILGNAMVDTGATISSVPLWMVHRLGIAVSEDSKQPAFGVGGQIDAYCIQVGVEAWIDGTWTDNDVVPALSPDTEWSRRQRARLPILLGRNGFLSRYNVCFDEPNKAMWLRKAIMEAQAGRAAWP